MDDYIAINKQAYDSTAYEFQDKKQLRRAGTVKLVDEFLNSITAHMPNKKASILELGPGSGYAAKLITERSYRVTGIEFSEPMAELAQKTAPKAKIVLGEFLTYDFAGETFDAILGVAFVHLFPINDAGLVMRKIYKLLKDKGIALISTTKHDRSAEGYAVKTNFSSTKKRFRHKYDRANLEQLLISCGFVVLSYKEVLDDEVSGKVWMNFTIQKSN